jgi:hypothetical protein
MNIPDNDQENKNLFTEFPKKSKQNSKNDV